MENIPTIKNLKEIFLIISKSNYLGVKGVLRINSNKPGPVLGITIQTHGNEPSGLAAAWYFVNRFPIQNFLVKGNVVFVINNIKATEKYFISKNEEEKQKARFIDINFNRLPENLLSLENDFRYEICRARELYKVWKNFDIGLDIHSTTQESEPMIVVVNKLEKELIRGFPVKIILSNIDNIQIGYPAAKFYGGEKDIPVLSIETGQHEKSESFNIAIKSIMQLMQNLKMLNGNIGSNLNQEYLEYKVISSLVFPDRSYYLNKIFSSFESVKKGQLIAMNSKEYIYAPINGHVIFCKKDLKPKNIDEEVLFYTKPFRRIKLH